MVTKILSALANANSVYLLNRTLSCYNFTLSTQLRDKKRLLFRFYVLRLNCDSILVGTAFSETNDNWQMKFKHYPHGQMPVDISDLMQWVEG